MMLHVFAEDHALVDVKRVLQEYFCVERSSDIPAEALGELLIRIGLDEKGIAAIRTELQPGTLSARAGPLQAKGRWFEVGADVSHQEHGSGYGRVVLGSESLAENDGKVLVQFDDNEGGEHGPKLFIDPAQLQVTRIWHPIHGPGVFLFEEGDG